MNDLSLKYLRTQVAYSIRLLRMRHDIFSVK